MSIISILGFVLMCSDHADFNMFILSKIIGVVLFVIPIIIYKKDLTLHKF